MRKYRSRKLWERRLALFFTTLFAWTFIIAPGATALSQRQVSCRAELSEDAAVGTPSAKRPSAGFRHLSAAEMSKIRGAGPGHALSVSASSGPAYPWEGNAGGVNTGNGNKLTTVDIVDWTQQGGLPVSFYLAHNSEGNHNSELGEKMDLCLRYLPV